MNKTGHMSFFFRGVFNEIIQNPFKSSGYLFAVLATFSILFTTLEIINYYFFPQNSPNGLHVLIFLVIGSLVIGLWKVYNPFCTEIKIPHINTVIEILFGDLFSQDGIRVIAVNEFFDTEIGLPVSPQSLHGIFIMKCFGGYTDSLDKKIDEQLRLPKEEVSQKIQGKIKRFPIGSAIVLPINADKYLLFALAKTESSTCKAFCDVSIMWDAMKGLWKNARTESGGLAVNIPLIGSNLAGVGLPSRNLLNLIILSIISETKSQHIATRVRIVLHHNQFGEINLNTVKQYWKE